jgi:hypothetical protein
MLAEDRIIGHFDAGHLASDGLCHLQPELTDLGLRFGIRGPIIGTMLIFTGNLAVIAAVAN